MNNNRVYTLIMPTKQRTMENKNSMKFVSFLQYIEWDGPPDPVAWIKKKKTMNCAFTIWCCPYIGSYCTPHPHRPYRTLFVLDGIVILIYIFIQLVYYIFCLILIFQTSLRNYVEERVCERICTRCVLNECVPRLSAINRNSNNFC